MLFKILYSKKVQCQLKRPLNGVSEDYFYSLDANLNQQNFPAYKVFMIVNF